MSKHSLDNDFEFRDRIDRWRLRIVDNLYKVRSTAFGGGWSRHEEDDALRTISHIIHLLEEWREKNKINNEEPRLIVTKDGPIKMSQETYDQFREEYHE